MAPKRNRCSAISGFRIWMECCDYIFGVVAELGSDSSETQMTKHAVVSVNDNEVDASNDKYLNVSHSPCSEPSSGCYSVRSMSRYYVRFQRLCLPHSPVCANAFFVVF